MDAQAREVTCPRWSGRGRFQIQALRFLPQISGWEPPRTWTLISDNWPVLPTLGQGDGRYLPGFICSFLLTWLLFLSVSGWSGVPVMTCNESAFVPRAAASSSPDTHAGLHLSLMGFPDFCLFVSPHLATLRICESNVWVALLSCCSLAEKRWCLRSG